MPYEYMFSWIRNGANSDPGLSTELILNVSRFGDPWYSREQIVKITAL
jgi:hypothetical protein